MDEKLMKAAKAWFWRYAQRMDRIKNGNPYNEDYTGEEHDLFSALYPIFGPT